MEVEQYSGLVNMLGHQRLLLLLQLWENIKQDERRRDPKSLVPHGFKIFCQNDEDGILNEIFQRIGTTNKLFIEIGVGAAENNTLFLLLQGWQGAWVDGAREVHDEALRRYGDIVRSGRLRLAHAFIQPHNLEELMDRVKAPAEFDLFSLDIDGNDYHVLQALDRWRPRVITLEYNAQFGPDGDYVMPYTPDHPGWPGNMAFGAALKPLNDLCCEKGYALVGCGYNGVNAFFVRNDLVGEHFSEPFTPRHHWRPPLYPLTGMTQLGHAIPDGGRSLMGRVP